MKRVLLMIALVVFSAMPAFAARDTATFGDYNASNVYRLKADTDGVLTFAADTGIVWPYLTKTTNYTLTAAQSGTTVVFTGSSNGTMFTLPAATVGLQYAIIADVAKWMYIKPASGEIINFSTNAANNRISNKTTAAIGDSITLFCATAGQWSSKTRVGTWTTEGN